MGRCGGHTCCEKVFESVKATSAPKLRCHKKNVLFSRTVKNPQQAIQISTIESGSGHRRSIHYAWKKAAKDCVWSKRHLNVPKINIVFEAVQIFYPHMSS